MDGRELLVTALAIVAPWAIVLVVALVCGYDITVTLTRRGRTRRWQRRRADDED